MLPDGPALLIFITAAIVLLLTPGPAVLYIVARSVDQGQRAGLVSAVGVGIGTLGHVAAASIGISALLVTSALAFSALKYAGAAYLIYLGIRKLREPPVNPTSVQAVTRSYGKIFRQGILVNLLNPKTALFFFAFLPQFIDPLRGEPVVQMFILGFIFVTLGVISDSLYALAAGSMGRWLQGRRRFLRHQQIMTGSIYIFLGLVTAISGASRKN